MDEKPQGKLSWVKTTELSLTEYLAKVIKDYGVNSQEFDDLVKTFGKEKLREIYKRFKQS